MHVASVLWAALGIGLLIFLHELGHFLAARLAKVRVEVFSIGFGPRLCGLQIGDTDFRVSLVPFGGFVVVAGQDPTDRRHPRSVSLYGKGMGHRALFWGGGVMMNMLFALVVFPLAFRAGVSFPAPVVGSIDPGSAAWEAGLQIGDRVRAVQGKATYSLDNVMVEVALQGSRPIALDVEAADGTHRTVLTTPHFDAAAGLCVLGIGAPTASEPPEIEVDADGAAAAAGLRTGDRLRAVEGNELHGASLSAALRALSPDQGKPVHLELLRDGARLEVDVTPRPFPEAKIPAKLGVIPVPRHIGGIRPGVPAVERLGLRRGDLLLTLDDLPFLGGDLAAVEGRTGELRAQVVRNGRLLNLVGPGTAEDRAAFVANVALTQETELVLLPTPGSGALAGGMKPGDRLIAIDGQPIGAWSDLRAVVERAGEKPLQLTVQRLPADQPIHLDETATDLPAGSTVELRIAPQRQPTFDLGLRPQLIEQREEVRAATFGEAMRLGLSCSMDLVKQLYVTMKRLVTGDVGAKNLGGIIRIGQFSYQAAKRGTSWFWYFLAVLSVNLAFVNLLPVPVLDGGHLLFLLIERIKGSPVSTRVLGYSQIVGLVFVLLLVIFVTYNDILRLF